MQVLLPSTKTLSKASFSAKYILANLGSCLTIDFVFAIRSANLMVLASGEAKAECFKSRAFLTARGPSEG